MHLLQADVSDEEEKDIDDVVLVPDDKYSAQSLDKMLTLVAVLVEKSRIDRQLHLSVRDTQALIGGGKVRSLHDHECIYVSIIQFELQWSISLLSS